MSAADEPVDYEHRYHHDPVFHAQVEVGAQAIIQRWQRGSVLNQGATDRAWAEAKLLAFTVLAAVDGIVAVHPDRECDLCLPGKHPEPLCPNPSREQTQ